MAGAGPALGLRRKGGAMSAPTSVRFMSFAPRADIALCMNCDQCLVYCPTGAVRFAKRAVNAENAPPCRNCRRCVEACPNKAIAIESWFDGAAGGGGA